MAEQQHCASCDSWLIGIWPVVTVNGYRYHSLCYVMREAPSVKATALVN